MFKMKNFDIWSFWRTLDLFVFDIPLDMEASNLLNSKFKWKCVESYQNTLGDRVVVGHDHSKKHHQIVNSNMVKAYYNIDNY
jgi:hypothetical protein